MSHSPIRRVLVANRGEIALRVMRTCADMGIETVAVFSDADADAPHVHAADTAVHIGPAPSASSYLNQEAIFRAAQLTQADAIHPGYGFLSENASFARACKDHGVIFIGPSPEAIDSMGSKIRAKDIATQAGVPIVPGYTGDDQSVERLQTEAQRVGFPVLLKASAGGGGKGMRIVHTPKDLPDALAAAKREALSSFGDDAIMIERYIQNPRHIEFQILADHHGNTVHLFERECSIQRRHQKIIEETPSPALNTELRAQMGAAAVRLAAAIGYTNAGTVEFITDQDGGFYFLEVNTRLQVEHPITEEITGVDLVRNQILIASGHPLPFTQDDLSASGAALECRLYAEDPAGGYLPQAGDIVRWSVPSMPGLRIDSGVTGPQTISVHYDPMIAKVITHAQTRQECINLMTYALKRIQTAGLKTNRAQLVEILQHPSYTSGDLSTHFLDHHFPNYTQQPTPPAALVRAAHAVVHTVFAEHSAHRTHLPNIQPGWRNNPTPASKQHLSLQISGVETPIAATYAPLSKTSLNIALSNLPNSENSSLDSTCLSVQHLPDGLDMSLQTSDGVRSKLSLARDASGVFYVRVDGVDVQLKPLPRFVEPGSDGPTGGCNAPMPGKVVQVCVEAGQSVAQGDTLVLLEAMKMEHSVRAPRDGVVESVRVSAGDQVEADEVLVVLEDE